jgi:hypothetical protein
MMGFCRIFFLDLPFWRFFGNDDLFFFFWSSRPMLCGWRVFAFAAKWCCCSAGSPALLCAVQIFGPYASLSITTCRTRRAGSSLLDTPETSQLQRTPYSGQLIRIASRHGLAAKQDLAVLVHLLGGACMERGGCSCQGRDGDASGELERP